MFSKITKILYSTDLSQSSTLAFEHACSLAKETGAEIYILHIIEALSGEATLALQSYITERDEHLTLQQERVVAAEEKLKQRQDHFWQQCHHDEISVRQQIKSIHVIEDNPASAIIDLATELSVDLIIMGTHDKGLLHNFVGNVAKKVLSRSKIPMLIVPLPKKDH